MVLGLFVACSTSTQAGTVVVSNTTQQPSSLLVKDSVVPVLSFVLTGENTRVYSIVLNTEGTAEGTTMGNVSVALGSDDPISTVETPLFQNGETRIAVPVNITFTASESVTVTVSIKMASDLSIYSGKTLRLSLTSVVAYDSVSGSFPISGNYHTINNTLNIGAVRVSGAGQDQNIAIGGNHQIIGSFEATASSVEDLSILPSVFHIETPGQRATLISNVELVNESGSTVAGPVDVVQGVLEHIGSITFTDGVILQRSGSERFTLKASVSGVLSNNTVLRAHTIPKEWGVRGQTYGFGIQARPFEPVYGGTMTLKGPALRISVDTTYNPTAVRGSVGFVSSRIILDASQSSEDIRIRTLPMTLQTEGLRATDISRVQLSSSLGLLNTGVNTIEPSVDGTKIFVFDGNGVTIPKGTMTTLSNVMNIASGANAGLIHWSVGSDSTIPLGLGLTSGNAVRFDIVPSTNTTTVINNAGAKMTSMTVSETFPDSPGLEGYKNVLMMFEGDPQYVFTVLESTNLTDWRSLDGASGTFVPDQDDWTFAVLAHTTPDEDKKFFMALGWP